MKRKLLYLTTIVLFTAFSSISAQTKVWDFGTDRTNWPLDGTGVSANKVVDLLGLVPGASSGNFGKVNTGTSGAFPGDSYTAGVRFQLGGGGGVTAPAIPTAKYLQFNVNGPCTVKVWAKTSTNGAVRNLYVTDGATIYGVATTNSGSNIDTAITTANVTAAGTLYIYSDAGHNLYKIEVVGATVTAPSLGVNDFQADAASNVYSDGKLVFVSNVKSDTQVDVYGISGVLVKSFKTGSDTSFDLNTGIYVVRSKSTEGEKSAKVLVN